MPITPEAGPPKLYEYNSGVLDNTMTHDEYLLLSERTERKFPEGKTIPNYVGVKMAAALNGAITATGIMDIAKRHLIYDMVLTDENMDKALEGLISVSSPQGDLELNPQQMETWHAAMGLFTEAGELLMATANHLFNQEPLDLINLQEELGDLEWYKAILHRQYHFDESVIRHKNIKKLKSRFPNRFTSEQALNRDIEKEQQILAEEGE